MFYYGQIGTGRGLWQAELCQNRKMEDCSCTLLMLEGPDWPLSFSVFLVLHQLGVEGYGIELSDILPYFAEAVLGEKTHGVQCWLAGQSMP